MKYNALATRSSDYRREIYILLHLSYQFKSSFFVNMRSLPLSLPSELADMGIGVALYFRFLGFLIGLLSILTVLSIPALLFTTSGFGMGSYTDTVGWSYGMIGSIGYPCEPLSGIAKNLLGCPSTNATLDLLAPGEKVGPNLTTCLVTHSNVKMYPHCFCGLFLHICLYSFYVHWLSQLIHSFSISRSIHPSWH